MTKAKTKPYDFQCVSCARRTTRCTAPVDLPADPRGNCPLWLDRKLPSVVMQIPRLLSKKEQKDFEWNRLVLQAYLQYMNKRGRKITRAETFCLSCGNWRAGRCTVPPELYVNPRSPCPSWVDYNRYPQGGLPTPRLEHDAFYYALKNPLKTVEDHLLSANGWGPYILDCVTDRPSGGSALFCTWPAKTIRDEEIDNDESTEPHPDLVDLMSMPVQHSKLYF